MRYLRLSLVLAVPVVCMLGVVALLIRLSMSLEKEFQALQTEQTQPTQQSVRLTMPPMDFYPSAESNIPEKMFGVEASGLNRNFTIFTQVDAVQLNYYVTEFPTGIRLTIMVEIQGQKLVRYGFCNSTSKTYNFNFMGQDKEEILYTELRFPGQLNGDWSYEWTIPIAFMCDGQKWFFYLPEEEDSE